jgi:hypothetical protein
MLNPGSTPIEMGYTINEFSNVLNGNFTSASSPYNCKPLSSTSWLVSHQTNDFKSEVDIQQMPDRKIGLLGLPVLRVSFKLISGNPQDEQQFFEKFFRYFHKGGG